MKRSSLKRSRLKQRGKKFSLTRYLDGLLRKIILRRDQHCQWCGAGKDGGKAVLQVAHILPKGRYQSMRYRLENVLLLCVGCHLYRWHKDPIAAIAWLNEARPGLLDRLTWMTQTVSKTDRKTERVMLEQLAR